MGLFIHPISALLMITLPYTTAFFYYTSLIESKKGIRDFISQCKQKSTLWNGTDTLVSAMMTVFYFILFVNTMVIISLSPKILERVLGISTVFTLSGGLKFQFSLCLIAGIISWAFIDPWYRVVYALSLYYKNSKQNAQDILTQIRGVRSLDSLNKKSTLIIALFFLILYCTPMSIKAEVKPMDSRGALFSENLMVAEMNDVIEKVINQPEYTWRLPQKKR